MQIQHSLRTEIKRKGVNMAAITQDKAKPEDLIEKRLDDMTGDTGEVRAAARRYYQRLVDEDIQLSEGIVLTNSLDSNELAVMGFVAGYEACLRSHGKGQ